jgi:cytochrome bd-type quinol oxidase subunit 2
MQIQKKYWAKIIGVISASFFPTLAMAQMMGQGWNKSNYDMTGLPHTPVQNIIMNIAGWLLMIIGFIAIIGFVISGILYLTAAGDEDQQEKAKRAMMYSITGVIVALAGLVVIYAVSNILGGTSF